MDGKNQRRKCWTKNEPSHNIRLIVTDMQACWTSGSGVHRAEVGNSVGGDLDRGRLCAVGQVSEYFV